MGLLGIYVFILLYVFYFCFYMGIYICLFGFKYSIQICSKTFKIVFIFFSSSCTNSKYIESKQWTYKVKQSYYPVNHIIFYTKMSKEFVEWRSMTTCYRSNRRGLFQWLSARSQGCASRATIGPLVFLQSKLVNVNYLKK